MAGQRDARGARTPDIVRYLKRGPRYYVFTYPGGRTDGFTMGRVDERGVFGFPSPLAYGWRSETPDGVGKDLADEIAAGRYNLTAVEASPKFGPLYVLAGTPAAGAGRVIARSGGATVQAPAWVNLRRRLWVAPARGYLVVRQETRGPVFSVLGPRRVPPPALLETREVTAARCVQGLWLPTAGRTTYYDQAGSPVERVTVRLSGHRVNRASASVFEPGLLPGMQFWDDTRQTMFYVDSAGALRPDPRGSPDSLAGLALTGPYSARWLLLASGATLLATGMWGARAWALRRVRHGAG